MNYKPIYTFYKDYIKYKAHIAHKSLNIIDKKRSHPYSVNFLLGCKNKHVIMNPVPFFEKFVKSLHVIAFFFKKNRTLLIVNTNPEYAHLIENFYQSTHYRKNNKFKGYKIYYCNEKWVGGLLTNWKQVSKSIQTFMEFSERFENFILQNNINFPRYKKMAQSFQGLYSDSFCSFTKQIKRPDIIFLINPNENRHVVEEAVSLKIPVIAITDSNTDLLGISFPIPGNIHSIEFVHYCLQWITRIIGKLTI
jgi:ribosomal protein S2